MQNIDWRFLSFNNLSVQKKKSKLFLSKYFKATAFDSDKRHLHEAENEMMNKKLIHVECSGKIRN